MNGHGLKLELRSFFKVVPRRALRTAPLCVAIIGSLACEPENVHLQFSSSRVSYCKTLMSQPPPPASKGLGDPYQRAKELGLSKGSMVFPSYYPQYQFYQRAAYALGLIDVTLYGGPSNSYGGVCQASERLWSEPQSAQQAANFFRAHPLELSTWKFYDDSYRRLDQLSRDYVSLTAILHERSITSGLSKSCPDGKFVLPIIGVNVFSPEETKRMLTDLQNELFDCTRRGPRICEICRGEAVDNQNFEPPTSCLLGRKEV